MLRDQHRSVFYIECATNSLQLAKIVKETKEGDSEEVCIEEGREVTVPVMIMCLFLHVCVSVFFCVCLCVCVVLQEEDSEEEDEDEDMSDEEDEEEESESEQENVKPPPKKSQVRHSQTPVPQFLLHCTIV